MIDRITPTLRPEGDCSWYHKWRTLLFMHWEVPVEELRSKVPEELEIDTFEGKAYIGLVPFTMTGIRPRWLPYLPGGDSFHETNVRTYVHFRGRDPGVWFFSLDAANPAAVTAARIGWHLKYHFASIKMKVTGDHVDYSTSRISPGPKPAELEMAWDIGKPIGHAQPGTFEHFLAERYFLYAKKNETLYLGQVHHTPYPLHEAKIDHMKQTLLQASGFNVSGPPMSVLYSPGVDVDVFDINPVAL